MFWRGLVHDWHKLLPSEFFPYARFFHNADGSKRQVRGKSGYYKPYDTGNSAFDRAWVKHFQRNDHHPQSWLSPKDGNGCRALPMSDNAIREMICDWQGAGRAQGVNEWWDVWPWYKENRNKLQLSPSTRACLEEMI